MKDKTDIIIPTWNNSDYTLRCLQALKTSTKLPYHVIWIDNGSRDEEVGIVKNRLKKLEIEYILVAFEKNRGTAKAFNMGMRLSTSEYFVLLDNDVQVTQGWLEKLINAIESNDLVAAVGPVTNKTGATQKFDVISKRLNWRVPLNTKIEDFVNSRPLDLHPLTGLLSHFCTLIEHKVIDKIGYLHEGFYCGGEDDDYNDRIRQAGWQVAICLNCFVHHEHRATRNLIRGQLAEIQPENSKLLRQRRRAREEADLPMEWPWGGLVE